MSLIYVSIRRFFPPLETIVESPQLPESPKSIGVICIFPLAARAGMAGAREVKAVRKAIKSVNRERAALRKKRLFSGNICLFIVTSVCPHRTADGLF